MALSDDLRKRVVGAVVDGGMSRNAAARRFITPDGLPLAYEARPGNTPNKDPNFRQTVTFAIILH